MKKKFVAVALSLCLATTALAGCGTKKDNSSDKTETKVMSVSEMQDSVLKDVESYVTIDDYSKIPVEVAPVAEVTEGAVDTEVNSMLSYYPYVFTGTCASGDAVNIDYTGKIDGAEFEGGSGEDYKLTLGSGTFIDGFEEQVEGMNIGDTKDINVTFPSDYKTADVAGKDAVFTVTLNYKELSEGTAELNDQWVAVVIDKEGITSEVENATVDGFRTYVKGYLGDQATESQKSEIVQKMLAYLVGIADYSKVPESVQQEYIDDEMDYQENYISNSYEMELDDYLEAVEVEKEDFESDVKDSAIEYMKDVLALKLIAVKEGIKVSQDDYDDYLQSYAEYYGYETASEFEEAYSSEYGTDLFESLLLEKVLEQLQDQNCEVTETSGAAAEVSGAAAE